MMETRLEKLDFKFSDGFFSETAEKRDVSITVAYSVPREILRFCRTKERKRLEVLLAIFCMFFLKYKIMYTVRVFKQRNRI